MVTPEQAARFAAEIEDYLREKHPGKLCLLGNLDHEVLRKWMQHSVPLRVILRGIDDTAGRPVRPSLRYYAPQIEKAIEAWRSAVGS